MTITEPLRLNIATGRQGEPAGFDTAIIKVPARWYVPVDGTMGLAAVIAGAELRKVSERLGASIDETLHHAKWTITNDPGLVRELGLRHDCLACRAGLDQALAALRENPDGELAVGHLWWAQQGSAP
jgi:hypothetical protein